MTTSWKKILCLLTKAVTGTSLTACEGDWKQALGTLGGAVTGGLAGSQIGNGRGRLVAAGLGTLLGAAAGSGIGKSPDRAGQLYLQQTTQRTLESAPSGQVEKWVNPDSGNRGTIRAVPAFQNSTGQYCREFQQAVAMGNETHDAYGTACRQPNGSWQVVG